jgi:hypothetical protein
MRRYALFSMLMLVCFAPFQRAAYALEPRPAAAESAIPIAEESSEEEWTDEEVEAPLTTAEASTQSVQQARSVEWRSWIFAGVAIATAAIGAWIVSLHEGRHASS